MALCKLKALARTPSEEGARARPLVGVINVFPIKCVILQLPETWFTLEDVIIDIFYTLNAQVSSCTLSSAASVKILAQKQSK